jgi:predicted dinucleotide-binding enzyme
VVVLAVPYGALDEALRELDDSVAGKTLVDVTNALTPDFQLALGFTTSGAEELQKKAPRAKVVKAFNTVFAGTMSDGRVKGQTLTLFVAGDDSGAKEQVLALGRDIGFDAVDAGPLKNARWLEALGYFNIQLGYTLKMGAEMGIKLVR